MANVIYKECFLDIKEEIVYRVIGIFNFINKYRNNKNWSNFFNTEYLQNLVDNLNFYSDKSKNPYGLILNYYSTTNQPNDFIVESREKLKSKKNIQTDIDVIFAHNYSSVLQILIKYLCKLECIKILIERNMCLGSRLEYANNTIVNWYIKCVISHLIENALNLDLANELGQILLIASDYINKGYRINKIVYIDKPDYLLFAEYNAKNIILPTETTSIGIFCDYFHNDIFENKKFIEFTRLLVKKWKLSKDDYPIEKSENIKKYISNNNFIEISNHKYLLDDKEFCMMDSIIYFVPKSNDFCLEELEYLVNRSLEYLKSNKSLYISEYEISDESWGDLIEFIEHFYNKENDKNFVFFYFNKFKYQYIINILKRRFKNININDLSEIVVYYDFIKPIPDYDIFLFEPSNNDNKNQCDIIDGMLIDILSDKNTKVYETDMCITFYSTIDKYKNVIIKYNKYCC